MDNIIDLKNNISLSDFKLYSMSEIDELFSINDNIEIEYHKVEELEYITIQNFLRNPEDAKKFLINFPTEDRLQTIIETGDENIVNKAPGFQQTFSSMFFKPISKKLHKVLEDYNYCSYSWHPRHWDFYTNCLYTGMKSYRRNYIPHVDEFAAAGNIYLTDIDDTYTAFFKYVNQDKIYYNINRLKLDDQETIKYINLIRAHSMSEGLSEWKIFSGDENFVEYHRIPSQYNTVSLYKGKYWHNVHFDASIPNRIRFSLVSVLR
jgi:hypothetical protein